MMSIYQKLSQAIARCEAPCEVIVIGSNDAAGSSRWRFPLPDSHIHRFDALAPPDSDVTRAVVHVHPGGMIFHAIDTSQDAPTSAWIHGISSLRPERNAQNLRSGSGRDKEFLKAHRRSAPVCLTPVAELAPSSRKKFFVLDLEGIDFDITLALLARDDVLGIGFEHALMTDQEVITLRCEAVLHGFQFENSDEDTVFLREF